MKRKWYKGAPPKKMNDIRTRFNQPTIYKGTWSSQMDRYWESDDGYGVMSRQLRTKAGVVEHVAIMRLAGHGDIPWAVKQEIKDELFGHLRTAIEVFPSSKNLVDKRYVYHLWVLPKDMKLPFGIHPTRDPMGEPVERGYDFDLEEWGAWIESDERDALLASQDDNYCILDGHDEEYSLDPAEERED